AASKRRTRGKIEKITIAVPAELAAEIKAAVKAGEFASTSEAVRDALRHWQRSRTIIALNDAELRRLIAEGRASGEPVDEAATLPRRRAKYAGGSAWRRISA